MRNPLNHARLLTLPEAGRFLDSVQLERLEHSFRTWAKASRRADTRQSRKRILMIFVIIRYTGARLNEALSLDPARDIDNRNHTLRLCKGAEGDEQSCRQVEIPESLSAEIRKALEDPGFQGARGPIFRVDPGHVRRKFYERAEAIGLPRELGAPDVIRRSRAVELMQSSMPLQVVQRILGHSTPNLAASYVGFSEEEMDRVARYFVDREDQRRTSARNTFFGKITRIRRGDIQALVEIVSLGGHHVSAFITNQSLVRLGLKPGNLIEAQVKAPSVMLFKGETEPRCSAENLYRGKAERILKGKNTTEVAVRIADGPELCSLVTEESRQRLDIRENDILWAAFSAYAVVLRVD